MITKCQNCGQSVEVDPVLFNSKPKEAELVIEACLEIVNQDLDLDSVIARLKDLAKKWGKSV